jgi:hypothetical protein
MLLYVVQYVAPVVPARCTVVVRRVQSFVRAAICEQRAEASPNSHRTPNGTKKSFQGCLLYPAIMTYYSINLCASHFET